MVPMNEFRTHSISVSFVWHCFGFTYSVITPSGSPVVEVKPSFNEAS